MKRLIFILLLFSLPVQAQEELESLVEFLSQESQASPDEQLWADLLEELTTQKIPLNYAQAEDLLQIPFLDEFRVHHLLQYRSDHGKILSSKELVLIKGWDELSPEQLALFSFEARYNPEINWRKLWRYGRYQVLMRSGRKWPQAEAFDPEAPLFLGNPWAKQIRWQGKWGSQLKSTLLLQQDPGEALHRTGGPDHWAGYLQYSGRGLLRSLVLGDYQFSFGQGLSLWSGLAMGKSAGQGLSRRAAGIRGFAGANENQFFRGTGLQLRRGGFDLNLYLSQHQQDGRIETLGSRAYQTNRLFGAGLHRSEAELEQKNQNSLRSIGVNLEYQREGLQTGVLYHHDQLAIPLRPDDHWQRKFQNAGDEFSLLAWHGKYLWRNFLLFGEVSSFNYQAPASLLGFDLQATEKWSLSYLFRDIPVHHQSLWMAPFAERAQNGERGHFLALSYQARYGETFQLALDRYRFRWPSYGGRFPEDGMEIRLEYRQEKGLIRFLCRLVAEENQSALKTQAMATRLSHWQGRSRVQWRRPLNQKTEFSQQVLLNLTREASRWHQGLLFTTDLRYKFNPKLSMFARIGLVHSPDFRTRLYAYERDLRQSFYIPAHFGEALRFSLLSDWKINQVLRWEVKGLFQHFLDRENTGSDVNARPGPSTFELRMQLEIRW